MLEITETPKAETDLTAIIQDVSTSPFIAQLTANEINRFMREKTIRFFYDSSDVLGFAAWQNIDADWSELGPVYIFSKARGKSLGTQFAKTMLTLNTGKKLFAVTKNPIVKKFLKKTGFRAVSLFALPRPIFVHLLRQLTFSRIITLFQKRSAEPVELYITDWRVGQGAAES